MTASRPSRRGGGGRGYRLARRAAGRRRARGPRRRRRLLDAASGTEHPAPPAAPAAAAAGDGEHAARCDRRRDHLASWASSPLSTMVDLRAQVGGTLTKIAFQDGQIVHQGDLLFVIDPRPFQIQLDQASAQQLPPPRRAASSPRPSCGVRSSCVRRASAPSKRSTSATQTSAPLTQRSHGAGRHPRCPARPGIRPRAGPVHRAHRCAHQVSVGSPGERQPRRQRARPRLLATSSRSIRSISIST